ncbi:MAG: bifunctional phosphopantothenoylcysteine decarboxylase/phosphopantothenate--cysteine ligase CoaBC [Candidatus Dadabacteria bacterium]|nr:bifunctional phosphopantothenoylcysteine decarboxylase/phosphopantothenate--cysteine ligase CoaBC [Candidatus Dadabacteria bacterium]
MSAIRGKNIVLGVTGGIAAYKACELVRALVKEGASVEVVMTQNAMEFVTPLTLQTLSGNKVATRPFDPVWESEIGHISLADRADLVVIAPATASFVGKMATGIADSLLATLVLATLAPVIVCPAMNVNMYNNVAVQENIRKLKDRGVSIVEPSEGFLACGWEGRGRLPETEDIMSEIEFALTPKDMASERVLVTAGATREHIDPVRFISNPSSGKMGYALAEEARMRGADVVLVSGKSPLPLPRGVTLVSIESADDMYTAVMKHLDWSTLVIKAAAVGDYAPESKSAGKIKKTGDELTLKLKRTRDILKEIGEKKKQQIVVGFAAETEDLMANAAVKLREKNADMIVANNVGAPGAGFESDTNEVHLLFASGAAEELPLAPKKEIAKIIFDRISGLRKSV